MSRISREQVKMMDYPVLKPLDPPPGMTTVALNRSVCVVGARNRVHLPLPSPMISRAHALLVNNSDGVYLRDLASTNHVFLNGSPVREVMLGEGDVVRVGPFAFQCVSGFTKSSGDDDGHLPPAGIKLNGTSREVALDGRTLVIGQREGCDLRITGEGIADVHAVIFQRDGQRFVRDLNTGSRTYLNDERVRHEAALHNGDHIRIGDSVLDFVTTESAAAPVEVQAAPAEEAEELKIPLPVDELEAVPEPEPLAESAPEPAPVTAAEAAPDQPADLSDSGPIPLISEDDQHAPEPQTEPPPVTLGEEPVTPTEEPSLHDEDSLVPVSAAEAPRVSPPEPESIPVEHDLAPPPSRPEVPVEVELSKESVPEPTAPAEEELEPPKDRVVAEKKFTRMLGDLSHKVSEVKHAWKDLRTVPIQPTQHEDRPEKGGPDSDNGEERIRPEAAPHKGQ